MEGNTIVQLSTKNLCMECGIDMGDCNPRQLCGKTRCDMKDVNYNLEFIDTPSMPELPPQVGYTTPTSFLSDENFEYMSAAKRTSEEAIDWTDLPLHIVFRVHSILPIQTKWGSQAILELKSREGVELKVWAPNNVHKDLKSGMKGQGSEDVYIKSLGKKETKSRSGGKRCYYDFETVFL